MCSFQAFSAVACVCVANWIACCVGLSGHAGVGPGFCGASNGVVEWRANTSSVTVNAKRPSLPFPRDECTVAAFALSCKLLEF